MDVSFCRGVRFATTLGFSPILMTKNFLETTRLTRYTDSRRWRLKFFGRLTRKITLPMVYNYNRDVVDFRKASTLQKLVVQLCPVSQSYQNIRNAI